MKTEIFAICDAANESNGKLNLLGAFDHFWAREAPVVHPACTIAIKLRFVRSEEGSHRVKLTFSDADNRLVLPPLNATVNVRLRPEDETTCANLILQMAGVRLPSFGEYRVELFVNDTSIAEIPAYVRRIPTPAEN